VELCQGYFSWDPASRLTADEKKRLAKLAGGEGHVFGYCVSLLLLGAASTGSPDASGVGNVFGGFGASPADANGRGDEDGAQ